jgi:pimeloyl-ACP methyl ester carboxylesterase
MTTYAANTINPTALAEWRAAGDVLMHQGRSIFLRRAGPKHAPALLLIHGFPTASIDWLPIWHALAEHYHVLAFDLLGFGFSDKPRNHRYSIHEQADIAQAVVQQEFLRDYHLLVHDYGVSVGQELLARMDDRSKPRPLSCVFLNGGLLPGQHRPRLIQRMLAGPLGRWFVHVLNQDRFEKSFRAVFGPDTAPSRDELDAFWSVIVANDGLGIQHKLMHYLADRRRFAARWREVLRAPPCPVGLINGSLDPVSGAHLANAVAAVNPRLPIWRLARIGHYPQTEAPAAVLAAYEAFHATLGATL